MMTNVEQMDVMIPRSFLVQRVSQETHDTYTIEINDPGKAEGIPFAAGQFNMLYLFGAGEVPMSMSGDPAIPGTVVHTTRVVGSVTEAVRKLRRGDTIGVRGPFGSHWPLDQAEGNDIVIIGGGIGLAPLRPVMYEVLARRERFGRIVLLYGTRTPSDILYRRELERWRARFDLVVNVTVDRAIGAWRGGVGVVTSMIPRAPFDPVKAFAFVCGPEVMMRFTMLELQKRGMPLDRIYVSMERNMKCAVGFCGRCQFGPHFICKDGPIFRSDSIRELMGKREV
jgi:NAD(P)H-flavin reductase